MDIEQAAKMGTPQRPTSQLEDYVHKSKEENKMMDRAVDPSTIDSLISMLAGQQESLIRAYAELEAELGPVIIGGQILEDLTLQANRPEYRSPLGERLVGIWQQYHELEQRIHCLKRNLNV